MMLGIIIIIIIIIIIQWNPGIPGTERTGQNCPQFGGARFSEAYIKT